MKPPSGAECAHPIEYLVKEIVLALVVYLIERVGQPRILCDKRPEK